MHTELENWVEWRKVCALCGCSADTRKRLRKYAYGKFAWYVQEYANLIEGTTPKAVARNAGDCWQRFETHMTIGTRAEGKTLKRWLFARVAGSKDPAEKVILGGAKVIMRDVVRSYIREEESNLRDVSLDRVIVNQQGDKCTLAELLGNEATTPTDPCSADLEAISERIAREAFQDLEVRQRVAILAKELKISLSHPLVEAATSCKKSMLSSVWRRGVRSLAERIQEEFVDESPHTCRLLAEMAMERIKKYIFSWARAEKCCAELLEYKESV